MGSLSKKTIVSSPKRKRQLLHLNPERRRTFPVLLRKPKHPPCLPKEKNPNPQLTLPKTSETALTPQTLDWIHALPKFYGDGSNRFKAADFIERIKQVSNINEWDYPQKSSNLIGCLWGITAKFTEDLISNSDLWDWEKVRSTFIKVLDYNQYLPDLLGNMDLPALTEAPQDEASHIWDGRRQAPMHHPTLMPQKQRPRLSMRNPWTPQEAGHQLRSMSAQAPPSGHPPS